jgi:trimeric autotransporter adhesin
MGIHRITVGCALLVAVLCNARAQTRVDLRTQAKSIDFSAVPTKPFQVGAALPANCSVGEAFFKTGETPGQNLYSCTAADVWTRIGLVLPTAAGGGQKTLTTDGTNLTWKPFGGDVAGTPDSLTVQKLQGRTISGAAPASNQVMRWNAAALQWEPSAETGPAVGSVFGRTGAVAAQTGDYTAAQIPNAVDRTTANTYTGGAKQTFTPSSLTAGARIAPGTLPGIPQTGDVAIDTGDGNRLKTYDGSRWVAASVPPYTGESNRVLGTDGTNPAWKTLGGDISGPPEAIAVQKIQGRSVSGASPGAGQVMRWNAASLQWEASPETPAPVTSIFGRTGAVTPQTGDYAASQVSNAVDRTAATTYTPGAKQTFAASGITAGLRILPGGLPSTAAAGDLAVDASDGNRLKSYDGSQWSRVLTAAENGNYGAVFGNQTAVTIPGADHTLTSPNLLVDCYDSSTPPQKIEPNTVTIDSSTYDITITFSAAQSGRCVVNGSGGGASGVGGTGGGAVTSVFGRTGAVTAQAGDYAFMQLSGTVTDQQIAAGLSANKIGAGTVDNTRFGYLANATGDIQQQINGKADAAHTHTLGGDARGSVSGVTVTALQNRAVAATVPLNGQALAWNSGSSQWEPANIAGGGGGASMGTQLGDFNVTRTSNTVLIVGTGCSFLAPCNVRVGGTVYSLTTSASVTLASGTGMLFVYVDAAGALTAGHNMTMASVNGLAQRTGISAFPGNAIPLYTWSATDGIWDANGGTDRRAFLSTKSLAAGTGIAVTEAGQSLISVDTAVVPSYLSGTAALDFPAIAPASCSADVTFTFSGAAPGNAVAPGWPAGLEAGLIGMMRVSAANQMAVRLCNFSGATIDPAAATFRATIVRSF